MKLPVIILCVVFLTSVQSTIQSIGNIFRSVPNEEKIEDVSFTDENLLFDKNYDDSMFFRKLEIYDRGESEPPDLNVDCLGLGSTLSNLMNSFFKWDANGTDALKILFYSSSSNRSERVTLQHGDSFSLEKADFDITRRTIFIVHGFLAHGQEEWIANLEQALFRWGNVNVFVVDWSQGADTWNYFKAALNTKTVGDQLATFISQIADQTRQWHGEKNWGPLHLIGHSLGAHICGYAAKELDRRQAGWPVHRITGLDPAQPCFRNSNTMLRLDREDAKFVDVIHTNARVLKKLGLGLSYPIGHADFYPNGGSVQPGCLITESTFWKYLPLPTSTIRKTICSHGRSYVYFIESINAAVDKNCTFWAREWDMSYNGIEPILTSQCNESECVEMGINAEKYLGNGTFLAMTGRESPYCSKF
ncbi:hypothetical protein QAD02_006314 [Eretmocerus hayati]|uniref:Uncharacterized protein n=1 Tax=Eretmocerus hayati TaxID=131215 RepID=A0ACC2N0M6_9HYME|nr:hypothetical protein QAD02_006314 [Eretmocerus hayati]